jgi:hypothetical protein
MADNDGKSLRRSKTSKRKQDEKELPTLKLRRTPVKNVSAMKLRSNSSASTDVASGKVDSADSFPVSKQTSNEGKHSDDVLQPADRSGYRESPSNESEEDDDEHCKAVSKPRQSESMTDAEREQWRKEIFKMQSAAFKRPYVG